MQVLRTNKLTKKYGSLTAVNQIDLSVEAGQIMGLLGPNGSGKTTTLGLILSILKPTSGDFEWFENRYNGDHRRHIGAILETPNFYPYLNADENLDIIRQIKQVDDSNYDELLSLVRLAGRRKSKFGTYSLGMKQRLAIAATLIGNPEIVIFDEPTNGLDPEGISEVRKILAEIASRGKTVIMASHILAEVEKICTHVTILKNGQLLSSGPVGSILSEDITIEISALNKANLLDFLQNFTGIHKIKDVGTHIECTADQNLLVSALNKAAAERGLEITHLVSRKRKLEEEFLEITSRK